LASAIIAALKDRRIAGHQHNRAFRLFERRPRSDGETACPVQLERQAGVPLLVGHLEQVDLRYRTGDIKQRINSAEGLQGLIDHHTGGRRLGQIGSDDQRFRASGSHRFGRLLQISTVPRDQAKRREITGETDSRRPTDTLACPRNNGY
jgi:hypothetical protein